jgi:hypothetical protein
MRLCSVPYVGGVRQGRETVGERPEGQGRRCGGGRGKLTGMASRSCDAGSGVRSEKGCMSRFLPCWVGRNRPCAPDLGCRGRGSAGESRRLEAQGAGVMGWNAVIDAGAA